MIREPVGQTSTKSLDINLSCGGASREAAAQLDTNEGSVGAVVRCVDRRPAGRQPGVGQDHVQILVGNLLLHDPLDLGGHALGLLHPRPTHRPEMDRELAGVHVGEEFLPRPLIRPDRRHRGNRNQRQNRPPASQPPLQDDQVTIGLLLILSIEPRSHPGEEAHSQKNAADRPECGKRTQQSVRPTDDQSRSPCCDEPPRTTRNRGGPTQNNQPVRDAIVMAVWLQEEGATERGDRPGDDVAGRHRHARRQGQRREEILAHSFHHGHGGEDNHRRDSRHQNRDGDFASAIHHRLPCWLPHRHVPTGVLDIHNAVVDHSPENQRQAAQRHDVQGMPGEVQSAEGREDRQGDGKPDDCSPP